MESVFLNRAIIAGNIHRLRLAANLKQFELAQNLHVSAYSVNAWEKEKTCPSLINVLSICNYFDIKVDDLIGAPSMINR